MNIEEIRNAYNAQPFRPFTLCMASGTRIAVRHREFLSLSPDKRTVIVFQPDGHMSILDVFLMTELQFQPLPQKLEEVIGT